MAENKTALIVVDVQNDFVEGGSLPVTGGAQCASRIAQYIETDLDLGEGRKYAEIVFTKDWHTPGSDNGGHMSETPDYVDTWPFHCVQGTPGAEFAPALTAAVNRLGDVLVFQKGMDAPAYSGFEGKAEDLGLAEYLRSRSISEVHVVGLAADYCVKATAMDAVKEGFQTVVIAELTEGINATPQAVAAEVKAEQADA